MTNASSPVLPTRLQHFPVAWFSVVMGLAGLTIAWSRAEEILELQFRISTGLLGLTATVLMIVTALYGSKSIRYPREVLAEFRHPVKIAFVPTFSISLLLISIALLHTAAQASYWLWVFGTALHLVITLYVVSSWIHHTHYETVHLNPAWFIPAVGNILVPIAGVSHAPADVSWFFFSLGLFFWPILTALVFNRLLFHGRLPDRMLPTLFILIAPPALGFISWIALGGELDKFAKVLYFVALAFTLLLMAQVPYFTRLPFFLSWWAYSFPIAAITIATLLMAKITGSGFYALLGAVLLCLLTIVVTGLVARTALAIVRREICLDGH